MKEFTGLWNCRCHLEPNLEGGMMKEPNVMLAPNDAIDFDSEYLKFPALGSVKLDGMRVKITSDGIFSRTHKKQRDVLHSRFAELRRLVAKQDIVLDGELWAPDLKFNEIMSAAADLSAVQKLQIHIFDMMTREEWYESRESPLMDRVEEYQQWVKRHWGTEGFTKLSADVCAVDQVLIRDSNQLERLYDQCIRAGHEGCVVRGVRSKYKHGRATLREGLMFKFKNWVTKDAWIVGFKQATRMKNDKEIKRRKNAMGQLEAVHTQDDRELIEAIGSVEVEFADGSRCYVGGGKGKLLENAGCFWQTRQEYIGRAVEIRYQEHGTKDKPRMGGILRFRPDLDRMTPSGRILEAFTPPRDGMRKVMNI